MTPEKDTQSETVSTTKAAEMLGVATTTVVRMIHRGDLRAFKLTPAKHSSFRVYVSSIEEVKQQREY